jgi:hypothetical protein
MARLSSIGRIGRICSDSGLKMEKIMAWRQDKNRQENCQVQYVGLQKASTCNTGPKCDACAVIPLATCRTTRPFTGIQRQDDLTVDLWDCLTIQQTIVLQGFFIKKYYDISLIRV